MMKPPSQTKVAYGASGVPPRSRGSNIAPRSVASGNSAVKAKASGMNRGTS